MKHLLLIKLPNETSIVNEATQWKQKSMGLDYNSGFEKYSSVNYSKKI